MKKKKFVIPSMLLISTVALSSCAKNKISDSVVSKYKITFDTVGGKMPSYIGDNYQKEGDNYVREVEAGEVLGKLPSPSKDNHIFLGWFLGNETSDGQLTSISTVNSDVTVVARYKVDTESIYLDYDAEVGLNEVFTVTAHLADELISQGVTFAVEDNNCVVKVNESSTSLTFKAIKAGKIKITATSALNPTKTASCEIIISSGYTLENVMSKIIDYDNYTYTGFTLKEGQEQVESVLKATSKSISQTDSQGLAVFSKNNIPRFGITYHTDSNNTAYYIDSKNEKNINERTAFNTTISRVCTDYGVLNKNNFQGVNTSNLNQSGDIFGFKALNSKWFSKLTSEENNNVYTIKNLTDVNEAMVSAALLKMTSPATYNDLVGIRVNDNFPYFEIAKSITTKITIISDEAIFVEIVKGSETHYGRLSNIEKTSQSTEIAYFADSYSKTFASQANADLEKLSGLGGIRNEEVTVNSTKYNIKTFFNQFYIYTYYPDGYIKAENSNAIVESKKRYIKDGKESIVGYMAPNNRQGVYSFTLPYYRNGLDKEGVTRDVNALKFSDSAVMSGKISANFKLVSSSDSFYKSTNLKYTFNSSMNIEGKSYIISYNDEVYNQFVLPSERDTTSLRRITAIRFIKDGDNITSYEVRVGHLENGDAETFDHVYTFTQLGSGYMTSDSTGLVDLKNNGTEIHNKIYNNNI